MGWGPRSSPPELGVRSKNPYKDLREVLRRLLEEAEPKVWQAFADEERTRADRDCALVGTEFIKGCEHLADLPKREVTDAVLSRVRSLELELVKAADLASQASAALCESVFAGDAFLALWTDSNDGLGRAAKLEHQLMVAEASLERETAAHVAVTAELRDTQQSLRDSVADGENLRAKLAYLTAELTTQRLDSAQAAEAWAAQKQALEADLAAARQAVADEKQRLREAKQAAKEEAENASRRAKKQEKALEAERAGAAKLDKEVREYKRAADLTATVEHARALEAEAERLGAAVTTAEAAAAAQGEQAAAEATARKEEAGARAAAEAALAAAEAAHASAAADAAAALAAAVEQREAAEAAGRAAMEERVAAETAAKALEDELAATGYWVPGSPRAGAAKGLGARLATVKGQWLLAEARVGHACRKAAENEAATAAAHAAALATLEQEKGRAFVALEQRFADECQKLEDEQRAALDNATEAAKAARADAAAGVVRERSLQDELAKARAEIAFLQKHCEVATEATLAPLPVGSQTFCAFCNRFEVLAEAHEGTMIRIPSVGESNGFPLSLPRRDAGGAARPKSAMADLGFDPAETAPLPGEALPGRGRIAWNGRRRPRSLAPGGVRLARRQDVARAGGPVRR